MTNDTTLEEGGKDMNEIIIVREQLKRHEGLRLKPYYCTADRLTIGYGRNLDDCGISKDEAEIMLEYDIQKCVDSLKRRLPDVYIKLNPVRKAVLINMCFNLGIAGLCKFKNTLRYMRIGNYEKAADNMLLSKWATQVGKRSLELANLLRSG